MGEQCPETKLNAEKVFNPNLRGWVIAMQNEPTWEGARHGRNHGEVVAKAGLRGGKTFALQSSYTHWKGIQPRVRPGRGRRAIHGEPKESKCYSTKY